MTILRAAGARQRDVRTFEARVPRFDAPAPDRTAQLEAEIAALEETLVALRGAEDRKVAQARDAGRREGEEQARHDFAARTASLAEAARDAVAGVEARLADHEGLAVLVAEAALARLFATPFAGADLVMAAIRRQIVALRRETVLGIHVSAADFPDEQSRAAATQVCGAIELVASADLPSGSCLIKLTLGELDVSLPAQWTALSALLHRLAAEGAAA